MVKATMDSATRILTIIQIAFIFLRCLSIICRGYLKIPFRSEIENFGASQGRTTKAYMANIRRGGRTKAEPKILNYSRIRSF